jgi:hypothetical protein
MRQPQLHDGPIAAPDGDRADQRQKPAQRALLTHYCPIYCLNIPRFGTITK